MKTAIYPGSFNPWHDGHADVLKKALKVFDRVIVAVGYNPDKEDGIASLESVDDAIGEDRRIKVVAYCQLLADLVNNSNLELGVEVNAVIRGLRNGQDLEYERTQQYWNEDLGIKVPTLYFITDRKLIHISSSAIRAVGKFKK